MSQKKTLKEVIQAIHKTLEEAEYQLSQLGERLQFLIGADGRVRIARRDKTGETAWPKTIVAELEGCDPMLWRPEYDAWRRPLDPGRSQAAAAGNGSGRLPGQDGDPKNGGSRLPNPPSQDD